MGNSNRVTLDGLSDAIIKELTSYSRYVQMKINKAGHKAILEVVRKTKDTAPFNAQAYHRHYVDLISSKSEKSRIGDETHFWYVKAPGYRLTHLLVHGHPTRDGGRTRSDPFLENAIRAVLPDYEKEIEEAIKLDL